MDDRLDNDKRPGEVVGLWHSAPRSRQQRTTAARKDGRQMSAMLFIPYFVG